MSGLGTRACRLYVLAIACSLGASALPALSFSNCNSEEVLWPLSTPHPCVLTTAHHAVVHAREVCCCFREVGLQLRAGGGEGGGCYISRLVLPGRAAQYTGLHAGGRLYY